MDLTPFFVLGGVALVTLLVVLIVIGARQERERQRRIRQWAANHGWSVAVRPDIGWAARLPGSNRGGIALLVSGMAYGRLVGVAEYSYTTESMRRSDGSRSTTTYQFIVTAVRLDAPYPELAVQSRGALSRLGRAMFGDAAAATGYDDFDRRYRVKTRHPALVRTLLGPALRAEHLADRVPEWSLAGQDLLTWQSGRISDPSQIPALAAQLVRVANLLGR